MAPSTMGQLSLIRDRLLIVVAFVALLHLGRGILIPLAYGLLTAMVLYPSVARLERGGVPRPIAITIGLVVVATLFLGIGGLLLWEVSTFLKELPRLSEDANSGVRSLREWAGTTLHLSSGQQDDRWTALLRRLPTDLGPFFLRSANGFFMLLFDMFIVPVFAALLLHGRRSLLDALTGLAGTELRARIPSILQRSVHRFAVFILGMVKVYLIVGVLNSVGLLLLGVPNAILFGMLTALMTIIPYIGIIISSLLPITMGYLATGNVWVAIGVIAVFAIVQYLEANIIFPKVVGAQLGLNTLASILIVLAGALLWGIAGMILFLPYVSILMMVSEDIPGWRPLVALLGRKTQGRSSDPG